MTLTALTDRLLFFFTYSNFSFCHTGVYSFGLFTTTIFANAGQVVTGNQTPHFLSACKPNYTALGCQSPLHYITERRACTGNPYVVASARKSFPSKDAALSFYSAIYTVVRNHLEASGEGAPVEIEMLCQHVIILNDLSVIGPGPHKQSFKACTH